MRQWLGDDTVQWLVIWHGRDMIRPVALGAHAARRRPGAESESWRVSCVREMKLFPKHQANGVLGIGKFDMWAGACFFAQQQLNRQRQTRTENQTFV